MAGRVASDPPECWVLDAASVLNGTSATFDDRLRRVARENGLAVLPS